MSKFLLTITALDEVRFRGEADSVTLPGVSGELTVLAEHMPLVTLLKEGDIRVHHAGGEESFAIQGGTAEINRQEVTVLVR